MRRGIALAVLLALAVAALSPAVQASHMTSYTNYPVEHDDLGSSTEPNFLGSTSVLGVALGERAIDQNLDHVGEPSSGIATNGRVLAPGCTDDSGRQPSGACGLWTIGALNGADGTSSDAAVPAHMVGVQGTNGPAVPGFTGLKTTRVKFLDSVANGYWSLPLSGVTYVEYNHKLADLGVTALLRSLDPNLGGDVVGASVAVWAWYGTWNDGNGNGVIDHLQASINPFTNPATPIQDPANEFQWAGNCIAFSGQIVPGWHCAIDPGEERTEMFAWVYPGNHHGGCGAILLGVNEATCDVPVDAPGKQVVCFANIAGGGVVNTVLAGYCGTDLRTMENYDERLGADPLLGSQGALTFDVVLDDRTGDPDWDTRQWSADQGWQAWYYDQSLVTSTLIVTALGCPRDSSAREYDLPMCRFLDIDAYPTWSPLLQDLLSGGDGQGGLKATARSNWVFVRDSYVPFNTAVDGARNSRLLYDQGGLAGVGLGPMLGDLEDVVLDPGWGREPNEAGDAYPGAVRGAFGPPDFEGKNTDFSGYQAAPRGWVDNQVIRALTYSRAVGVSAPGLASCQLCVAGPGLVTSASPEPMPGDFPRTGHARSLGPGQHYIFGLAGLWLDKAQAWEESVFDLLLLDTVTTEYLVAPDGWVGNVVNATGTFYYRGYTDEACAQQGVSLLVPYGWCHPYLDGNLQDPQQPGTTTHGEWRAACNDRQLGGNLNQVVLQPEGGTWTVPTIVLRNHDFIDLPGYVDRGAIEDFTGRSEPIVMGIRCDPGIGIYAANDMLVLPAGNLGLRVTTSLLTQVGTDLVLDVDTYEPWGA